MKHSNLNCHQPESNATRREFLQQAAGATMGLTAVTQAAQPAGQLLPTVRLGKHEITRLIIGGNPISIADCNGALRSQSTIEIAVGLFAHPNTAAGFSAYFDDVEVAVTR